MSLTSMLGDAGSPVRAYIDSVSPLLAVTRGTSSTARGAAQALGLGELARRETLVPPNPNVDRALSGTAFDIRARIELGGFDLDTSASAAGIQTLPDLAPQIDNGVHRVGVLSEAFSVAQEMLNESAETSDLARASILLGYCEQIYRGGANALSGSLGTACDTAEDGWGLAKNVSQAALVDIKALMEANRRQLGTWKERVTSGIRFEPNPTFSGSKLVGGADGDWMIGDALIDCKAHTALSIPKLRDFLRQLLGYVMLDSDDSMRIREVCVWLPRQAALKSWKLEQLLGGEPEILLPKLRAGFIGATKPNQVAVHVPVTQRRKLQLLADNRHTPERMLLELSADADSDLRFRVGRNASAPMRVIRHLATDRYASVRRGVAMNTAAPADVLQNLAVDKSIMVRRTVADNPRSEPPVTLLRLAGREGDSGLTDSTSTEIFPHDNPQPSAELLTQRVEISQDRDPNVTSGVSLNAILNGLIRGSGDQILNDHLPQGSQFWARKSGRLFKLPVEVASGLPPAIIMDLFSPSRPQNVRLAAARMLPIGNTEVRSLLFSDKDPEVRWQALERSTDDPDPLLGEVLAELGSSREKRIDFVTDRVTASRSGRSKNERSDKVAQIIARHPATPSEILDLLVAEKSAGVLLALASNPSLRTETLEQVVQKMLRVRTPDVRSLYASSKGTPNAVFENLSVDKNVLLRIAVAKNMFAPVGVLSQLAQDSSVAVRLAAMANKAVPDGVAAAIALKLLTVSEDHNLCPVVVGITERPDMPVPQALVEDALERLSKSRVRDPEVRRYVAGHTGTSGSTLARLSLSEDSEVRRAVSGNPATKISLLETLARDRDPIVRSEVARNERTPQDLLNALLLDEDEDVRIAAYRYSDKETTGGAEAESLEVGLAPRFRAPSIVELQEMAANARAEVRICVAYSEYATPDILSYLGGERRSVSVRRAVAAHPKTLPETLRALAKQNDSETLMAIAFHEGVPVDVLADVAGRSTELALLVALNPDSPIEVIVALAEDTDLFVKFVAEAQLGARKQEIDTRRVISNPCFDTSSLERNRP